MMANQFLTGALLLAVVVLATLCAYEAGQNRILRQQQPHVNNMKVDSMNVGVEAMLAMRGRK